MTTDTAETFLAVCENIASGDTVAQACKAAGIGERTFFRALAADGDGNIAQAYARARRFRADKRAAEIEDLARRACLPRDDKEHVDPNGARVAIDSLKWLAARENNGRYGERIAVDTAPSAKSALSRADALTLMQSGALTIDQLMDRWTKPVVEALPASRSATSAPDEVLDCDV
jgi:hypothetical protein